MSITSDEVNFLVYRYLQESGFQHAAFGLWNESYLAKSSVVLGNVPPGGLITLLQKGLLYVDVEWHVTEDGIEVECEDAPTLLTALGPKPVPSPEARQRAKERDRETKRREAREKEERKDKKEKRAKAEDAAAANGDDEHTLSEILPADVTTLTGHESEVFTCAWNPQRSLLASGSGDASAIIWDIPTGPCGASNPTPGSSVLRHYEGTRPATSNTKDVTTLDWNGEGTLLATGSYDGVARIWSDKGQSVATLHRHKAPIFAIRWNKGGDMIVSGSIDKTAVVWDAQAGAVRQQFEFHNGPILDVDWRDNTSFASCSSDSSIVVCQLGDNKPVQVFQGHKADVNAIAWDPTGKLLASCSDDHTAKIWRVSNDQCVLDFKEHSKEIYTTKWNPVADLQLATASFDTTVKLWDANVGKCLHTLTRHREPVYSLAYSPDGRYVASGSYDCYLHIWSVKDGTLVKSFHGSGGIFDVSWNNAGTKLAACLSNNTVCVMDLRL